MMGHLVVRGRLGLDDHLACLAGEYVVHARGAEDANALAAVLLHAGGDAEDAVSRDVADVPGVRKEEPPWKGVSVTPVDLASHVGKRT